MIEFDKAFKETPLTFSQGIDRHLEHLQQEDFAVKRKSLSVILVAALLLVLLTASAFAIANKIITRENPGKMEALSEWIQGFRDTTEGMDSEQVNEAYIKEYQGLYDQLGDPLTWSLEERKYFDDFKVELFGESSKFNYALPTEECISQEEAIEIAVKQVAEVYSIKDEVLETYLVSISFVEDLENRSVWQIVVIEPSQNEAQDYYDSTKYVVKIDASTGAVVSIVDAPTING